MLLILPACSSDVQKPAPLGDYAVLEQLAAAYRTVGEQYPRTNRGHLLGPRCGADMPFLAG